MPVAARNLSRPLTPTSDVRGVVARQAVLFAPRDLRLCDFTPPPPGAGELLLRVKCALSCGTDLKTYRRGRPLDTNSPAWWPRWARA